MEQEEKKKISLRLNLLDSVILLLALAVGGYVLWQGLSVQETVSVVQTQEITYTIMMKELQEDTCDLVAPGTTLVDAVKNYQVGEIVSSRVEPAERQVLDHENKIFRTAYLEGSVDVHAVVKAEVVDHGTYLSVDNGFILRVGTQVFLRGEGYMASGYITHIDRLEGD